MNNVNYQAIIIGASAGAFNAFSRMFCQFPANFSAAIIAVCHRQQTPDSYLTEYLASISPVPVQDAEHLALIEPGNIYIAPPGYHLLVADDHRFNLSADPLVNLSRPSIDVAFESAAEVYGKHLIGVVLTGANADGTAGLRAIKKAQGYVIVQDPKTAQAETMPHSAITNNAVDYIGPLDDIAKHIRSLCGVEVVTHE